MANPDYVLPQEDPQRVTQEIVRYWVERWLSARIRRDEVMERVKQHDLFYPIRHGARVPMPPTDDELQLFHEE